VIRELAVEKMTALYMPSFSEKKDEPPSTSTPPKSSTDWKPNAEVAEDAQKRMLRTELAEAKRSILNLQISNFALSSQRDEARYYTRMILIAFVIIAVIAAAIVPKAMNMI
jgi:hypothetical protein